MDVRLRPASEQDREFLYALHCATMRDVIEQTWGWDDAWQRANFEERFADFAVSVIEADSRPVGERVARAEDPTRSTSTTSR